MTETHPTDLEQPFAFVLMMRPGTAHATVATLREGFAYGHSDLIDFVVDQISKQTPVPLPEKVGAVVESGDGTFYIRWAYDSHTHNPWIMAVNHENPIKSEDLPLITKVHFEGVDI